MLSNAILHVSNGDLCVSKDSIRYSESMCFLSHFRSAGITKLNLNDQATVVSKGGYTILTTVYSVNKNQGSEHCVMMTLLKAIRDIYCVKNAQY